MAGMRIGRIRIELNVPGFNEYRKQPGIQGDLHDMGERIADAAGGGDDYAVVDDTSNPTRARVVVKTDSFKAMADEAKNRTLSRALDAGRR